MNLTFVLDSLNIYILVFFRVAGMILFNPLLSRRNVPGQIRAALCLGLTLLLAPGLLDTAAGDLNGGALILAMGKELALGLCGGVVFQYFYYLIFLAGDVIDTGFGLSMAKAFDPGTSIQMSLSGNLFQLIFILYLFATNSHLLLIRLIASSYDLVGIGAVRIGTNLARFMTTLFVSAFSLVMRLALPFLAASFVLEMSMGVLMKLIPQINVFSIHFQFKIILGIFLLFLFAVPTANFLENYMNTLFVSIQNLFLAAG